MIDAHVHLWRISADGCTWPGADLPALYRDFGLADFRATPGTASAEGVILVQSQEDTADKAWLLTLAERDALIVGVIGWCDLRANDAPRRISELASRPKLRGLRPMVQDCAADGYDDPALDAGLAAMAAAGLVLEALVRPQHLAALERMARRHPALRIVIDHAAKPDVDSLQPRADAMRTLAAHPAVRCKASGLVNELRSGQDRRGVADIVTVLLDTFGPERLMWGSDWPVVQLAEPYADWLDLAQRLVPAAHHAAVFQDTAAHIYGLAA